MVDVKHLHVDLVRFPCLSHEEEPIADFVEGLLRGVSGLDVGRLQNNVWASLGDGDDLFLLNSHLDVVPASSEHPYPPFEPTEVDGRVYGRGAVDAKASGAAMLAALIHLAEEEFAPEGGRVVMALTACEESGGGYNGMQHVREEVFGVSLPEPVVALVGEPTELRPCLAQKGLLILKLHAAGKTAHAARSHLGENAIHTMMKDMEKLQHLKLAEDPLLGPVTVTPTRIEGGTANNVVPDACTATLDIRSTPSHPHRALVETIRETVESEVEVHSDRLVPCATPRDNRLTNAVLDSLSSLGKDNQPFGSPTASDWVFLHDIPTVKIGPGRSELSHTPDEHVEVIQLLEAVEVYKTIVRTYFSNDFTAEIAEGMALRGASVTKQSLTDEHSDGDRHAPFGRSR